MFRYFKYFIFILPLIEIALFVIIGRILGLFWTLALVILTTVFGFWLIRKQNFAMMQRMQQAVQTGQPPPPELMGNSLTMFAGIMLIIPGFFTDTIGILLLIPGVRTRMMKALFRRGTRGPRPPSSASDDDGVTLDGEYQREKGDQLDDQSDAADDSDSGDDD